MSLCRNIDYLTISDIHCLNDLNETAYIAGSIKQYFHDFSPTSPFKDLDIIFIAGDIFDTYKDSKSREVVLVLNWMREIMGFCARHRIKLRVLKGTPGHDYDQSELFTPLSMAYQDTLDYKYVDILSTEKMDDLGITVLYVPDEWAGSASKCKDQIIDLMHMHHIEKFDIACMHGMFDFQIPDLGEHPLKHDTSWYLSIVNYFINIGHDHGFKTFDRVLVQGSFDRIAHGEEGKKGGIICHLRMDGKHWFEFIENKRARVFKTIVVKTKDLDQGIEQVRNILDKLPDNSHIRISTTPDNPILTVLDEFKKANPRMVFKRHKDKKQNDVHVNELTEMVGLSADYNTISLTRGNIIDMVFSNIQIPLEPHVRELIIPELQALV